MITLSNTLIMNSRRSRGQLCRAIVSGLTNHENEVECPRVRPSKNSMRYGSRRTLAITDTKNQTRTNLLQSFLVSHYHQVRQYTTSSFLSDTSSQAEISADEAAHGSNNDPSSILDRLLKRVGPISTIRNPWEKGAEADIGSLDFFPPLDYSSRHIIQLLQELNFHGFHATRDSASLDRCVYILTKIFDQFQAQKSNPRRQIQCVQRACAILENMEVFRSKDHDPSPNLPINRLAEWPVPNRVVYDIIFKMFRMTGSSPDASFPRKAQAILTRMEELSKKNPDDWNVLVTNDHWNAVLICWGKCQDWQKALFAATETFTRIQEPNVDVFFHMMLVCTSEQVRKPQDRSDEERKAVEIGAQVAARLWRKHIQPPSAPKDTESTTQALANPKLLEKLSSNFYHTTFRAFSAMPLEDPNRLVLIDELMTMAKKYGQVNTFLLHDFLVKTRKSELIFEHLGRKLMNSVAGKKSSVAADKLFKRIPQEWKAHATMTKQFRVNR